MLQFHRPLHCSATVQLGALTTRPSLPSMPSKERSSPYTGGTFDCLPAWGSARHAAVVSSNRPASHHRAVALRQPSLLPTCESIQHLRQVPQRTCSIPHEEHLCKRTWRRFLPMLESRGLRARPC
jgi:hypothetical protein